MRLIRHRRDFANPVSDSDRMDSLDRPAAAPDCGRSSPRRNRCDGPAGRSRRAARTGDPARPPGPSRAAREFPFCPSSVGSPGRQRRKVRCTPAADHDRQSGRVALRRQPREEREDVRLLADRVESGNHGRAPEPRQARPFLRKPLGEARPRLRRNLLPPRKGLSAEKSLRIGVSRTQGVCANPYLIMGAEPRRPLDGDPGRLRK